MSVTPSLVEILTEAQRVLRTGERPERLLDAEGPEARLESILSEVNQTVLPRALVFVSQDERSLTIETRNRRAVRISQSLPETPHTSGLRGRLESSEASRADKLAAIAGLVAEICAGTGAMAVMSQPSTLPPSVVDKGFGPEEIGQAVKADNIGRDVPDAAPAPAPAQKPAVAAAAQVAGGADSDEPHRALINAAAQMERSSVLADGMGTVMAVSGGDEPIPVRSLARPLSMQVALNGPFLDVAVPGPKLIYAGPEDDSAALCFSAEGNEIAAAAILPEDAGQLAQAWLAAVRAKGG